MSGQRNRTSQDRAAARAIVYSFLAQMLAVPGEALAGALGDGSLRRTVAAALAGASGRARQAIDANSVEALIASGPVATVQATLLQEYTRLFGTDVLLPHYEGDYVGSQSFRALHAMADVAGFYTTFGVRVAAGAHERCDYIGMELEFMNLLATKEAHAAAATQPGRARLCRRAQTKFFNEHLGRWAPAFAKDWEQLTLHPAHRAAAQIMAEFLRAEAAYLGGSDSRVGQPAAAERPATGKLRVVG
jgi:DMSO reductase family type II enzyme chaperone